MLATGTHRLWYLLNSWNKFVMHTSFKHELMKLQFWCSPFVMSPFHTSGEQVLRFTGAVRQDNLDFTYQFGQLNT